MNNPTLPALSEENTYFRHQMISTALLKKIWTLSWPVIVTNIMQTSITIIDTYMIGRLGPMQIAAVGMSNTIRLLVLISILSVTGGAMSLMAQAKGGRDPQRMSFVTRQSLLAGLMISLVIGGVGILIAKPLLLFMNGGNGGDVIALGANYLYIIFLGTPFVITNFGANRLMQGAGDMRTPMYLIALLMALNVGFNYIFIFGWGIIPAYGITGAAIGTVVARGLLALIQISIFYSRKNVVQILEGSWKPDFQMIKDILAIGIPSGIQGIFRHGGNILILGIVTMSSLGTLGAAAIAICTQIESIVTYTAVGINVPGSAMVGQALGRWQTDEAYKNGTSLIFFGLAAMVVLVIPILIFSEELVLLFDPSANETVLAGALSYLFTNTMFLPVSAFGILITGTLRGAGDTQPAMVSAFLGRNVVAIVSAYILAFPLGYDYWGIWWGIVIGRIVDSTYLWIVWKRKKWQMVSLKKTDIYRRHLIHFSSDRVNAFLNEIRKPQMATPGTLEIVHDRGVTYQRGDTEERFDLYEVEEQ